MSKEPGRGFPLRLQAIGNPLMLLFAGQALAGQLFVASLHGGFRLGLPLRSRVPVPFQIRFQVLLTRDGLH